MATSRPATSATVERILSSQLPAERKAQLLEWLRQDIVSYEVSNLHITYGENKHGTYIAHDNKGTVFQYGRHKNGDFLEDRIKPVMYFFDSVHTQKDAVFYLGQDKLVRAAGFNFDNQ